MFKQLPVKKEYLLTAATVIMLWACYQFAFKNTLDAWQTNNQLKTQLAQATDISTQPDFTERENGNLNKILNLYKADTSAFRNKIINTISNIADKEHVKLVGVPTQDLTNNSDHVIIEKLEFDGDYFSLLKLSNSLERTNNIGIIRSVTWKVSNPSGGNKAKEKLGLQIYIEILK